MPPDMNESPASGGDGRARNPDRGGGAIFEPRNDELVRRISDVTVAKATGFPGHGAGALQSLCRLGIASKTGERVGEFVVSPDSSRSPSAGDLRVRPV